MKSATVKFTGIPKTPSIFCRHSDRRLGKQVTAFSTHTQRPLSVNLAKLPIQKSEEFEVGNGKNYRHPKKSPIFLRRSVKILVRIFFFAPDILHVGDTASAITLRWATLPTIETTTLPGQGSPLLCPQHQQSFPTNTISRRLRQVVILFSSTMGGLSLESCIAQEWHTTIGKSVKPTKEISTCMCKFQKFSILHRGVGWILRRLLGS